MVARLAIAAPRFLAVATVWGLAIYVLNYAEARAYREGRLLEIEPHSGHYKPTDEEFCRVLKFLTEQGLNIDNVDLGGERWRYGKY